MSRIHNLGQVCRNIGSVFTFEVVASAWFIALALGVNTTVLYKSILILNLEHSRRYPAPPILYYLASDRSGS